MKRIALFIVMAVAAIACTPEETVTPELKVLTEEAELVAPQAESQVTIDFETNVDWTADFKEQSDSPWYSMSPNPASGAAGSHKLVVTCLKNETTDNRTVTVVIKAQDISQEVVITQLQQDVLIVGTKTFDVPAEGGEVKFRVSHNVDFEATTEAEWLTKADTKALTETEVVFNVAANTITESRTATIIVSDGTITETITVNQAAFVPPVPEFTLSATELWLAVEGGSAKFTVESNVEYNVTMAENEWLSMSENEGVYTFTAVANPDFAYRVVSVTIAPADEELAEYAVAVNVFQNGRATLAWNKVPTVDFADYATGNPVRLAKYGEYLLLANLNRVFAINPADGSLVQTYTLPEGSVCQSLCVDEGGNIIIANNAAYQEIVYVYTVKSLTDTPRLLLKYHTGNYWCSDTGNIRVEGNIDDKACITAFAAVSAGWISWNVENGEVADDQNGWDVFKFGALPYAPGQSNWGVVVPNGSTLADGLWFVGYQGDYSLRFCEDPTVNTWTSVQGTENNSNYNTAAVDFVTLGDVEYAAVMAGAFFGYADPYLLLCDITDKAAAQTLAKIDLGQFAQRNADWSLVNYIDGGTGAAHCDVLVETTDAGINIYFADANFNMIGCITIK